jgi:hypothetical protein
LSVLLYGCNNYTAVVENGEGPFDNSMAVAADDLAKGDRTAAIRDVEAAELSLNNSNMKSTDTYIYDYARAQSALVWLSLPTIAPDKAASDSEIIDKNLFEAESHHAEATKAAFSEGVVQAETQKAILSVALAFSGSSMNPILRTMAAKIAASPTIQLEELRAAEVSGPTVLAGKAVQTDGTRLVILPSIGSLLNIGRLMTQDASCTASLVGPRLAITNAHCVTDLPPGTYRPGNWKITSGPMTISFEGLYLPDRVNVVKVHLATGDTWLIGDDALRTSAGFDRATSTDWALLELDRHPSGRGYFALLPQGKLNLNQKVYLAGFSGDLNDGRILSMHWGCSLAGASQLIVAHRCKMFHGASGSPILLTGRDFPFDYIVGLNANGPENQQGGHGPSVEQFRSAVAAMVR